MTIKQIRNWLGLYFLLITSVLGGYILMFKETSLLPISKSEGIDAFEIIIPVLVGQLTIIFKWFGIGQTEQDKIVDIPVWVVKGPPIIVAILLIGAVVNLVVGNSDGTHAKVISPDSFKAIVTFSVTLLNATTLFIIARFFKIE